MRNGPFEDVFLFKKWGFSIAMLVYRRVVSWRVGHNLCFSRSSAFSRTTKIPLKCWRCRPPMNGSEDGLRRRLLRVYGFCFSFLLLKVFVVKCKGKQTPEMANICGIEISYSLPTSYELWFKTTYSMWIAQLACRQVYLRSFSHLGGQDI